MIDYSENIVNALEQILPVYLDTNPTGDVVIPCISYKLNNDNNEIQLDELSISELSYIIKVWSDNYDDIQKYSKDVDRTMRQLGFKRTSINELDNNKSLLKQRVFIYRAKYWEKY